MAGRESIYRSETSLDSTGRAMEWNRNPLRISGAQSFDFSCSPQNYAESVLNVGSPPRRYNPVLSSSHSHRDGFSKSMFDLSSSRNGSRKSVMFEEDIFEHKEMLQRARNRFKELELKYPEIFKNSRTSSELSSSESPHSGSIDQSESFELKAVERQDIQTSKTDTLQVLGSGENDYNPSTAVAISRRRPPPLSVAMKLHNLEDSYDSAFDEIDHDRDSVNSKTSHEPTPTCLGVNKHFLYPGDSVESDKDSGISTDRTSNSRTLTVKPVVSVEIGLRGTQSLPTKSQSLIALSSLRRNSLEYVSSASDFNAKRVDRRGILKSVAYRNQEIKSESLDSPGFAVNHIHCNKGRQSRSVSLSNGNNRRGEFSVKLYYCCSLRLLTSFLLSLSTRCLFVQLCPPPPHKY